MQLLVEQAEEHGAFVTLRGLSQSMVELSLQVVDISEPLLAAQFGEIGRGLVERVDGQNRQTQICGEMSRVIQ